MLHLVNDAHQQAEKIAAQHEGKKTGDGWLVKCPAHNDSQQSCSVNVGNNGKLLLHCHAGCSYESLLDAFGLNKKVTSVTKLPQKELVATYQYKNADGTIAFEKRRYKPKTFTIRRWDNDNSQWVFKGATKDSNKVLYNLPEIIDTIANKGTVIVCEGEKDADNVNALKLEGYIATTNFEGAKGWKPHYTEQLKGASIVILEDNDQAGRERSHMIALNLGKFCPSIKVVRFDELPPKSDVSDWLALKQTRDAIIKKFTSGESLDVNPWLALDEAKHSDYINFVLSLPNIRELRKEKLSDVLYSRDSQDNWKPTANLDDYIRGHARDYDCFNPVTFKEHLARHAKDKLKPELLIDLEEWDGVDRVKEICEVVRFSNISQDHFYQLLCHFGAGMFHRLNDHEFQQPTLIFEGAQGMGKDAFLQAVFGGLGMYMKDLDLRPQREVEALKQLHTAILFNIPEFDRTSRSEIATLKHLLTTASTDVRLAYERADEQRLVRASFVASANLKDVIADHTGARRFWLLNGEFMGFELVRYRENGPLVGTGKVLQDYPGLFCRENHKAEQLQILAQFNALYKSRFKAAKEAIASIQKSTDNLVPESAESMMLDQWEVCVEALTIDPVTKSAIDRAPLFSLDQVAEILFKLQRDYGYPRQKVQGILNRAKRTEHKERGRCYRSRAVGAVDNTDLDQDLPF